MLIKCPRTAGHGLKQNAQDKHQEFHLHKSSHNFNLMKLRQDIQVKENFFIGRFQKAIWQNKPANNNTPQTTKQTSNPKALQLLLEQRNKLTELSRDERKELPLRIFLNFF